LKGGRKNCGVKEEKLKGEGKDEKVLDKKSPVKSLTRRLKD